ncbi:MAG: hypothetical protein A2298_00180 [Gammaproteobacteria bacterium RIFOXYB2_FULL_38_6]|nr:MAG: hypothetical protein A2298_00180 [Gammaproteobacteria bacterium RIFOXYB2_FULL_38_6]
MFPVNEQKNLIESAEQEKMIAKISGQLFTDMPDDLFIPPDALRIFLEAFEGPLDLLLYLIRKQNIDILDIPIVEITKQYAQYVELMREMHLDLAAEYLVMAATLAEIKSRLLLPRHEEMGEEGDPRAELVRRLQEYERFKKAAEDLNELPRVMRDIFLPQVEPPTMEIERPKAQVSLEQMLAALQDVLMRASFYSRHQVLGETLSIRERMTELLSVLKENEFSLFTGLFRVEEGKMGVVVTLMAILELTRQGMLEFLQEQPFAMIYVRKKQNS